MKVSAAFFAATLMNAAPCAAGVTMPTYDIAEDCQKFADPVDTIYASQNLARRNCLSQEGTSFGYLSGTWQSLPEAMKKECLAQPLRSLSYRYSVLAVCVRRLLQEQSFGHWP